MKQLLHKFNINRSFSYLSLGRLFSQFGDKLYLLALPWLVLDLTHSALQSSITLALELIPEILFAPFIGVYVDRKSRKFLMVFSDIARGIIVGGISLLALLGQIQIFHIYSAAILLSIFTLLFDSSSQGYIPKIIDKEHLVEANANLTLINTLMRLIGPVLSGIFISFVGASGTIGITAVSFILSGLILILLPKDNVTIEGIKKAQRIFVDIKKGFQYLMNHEVLLPIAIFSNFMNIGITLVTTLLIFESKETLGYSSYETSLIFWISGICAVITTLSIKHLRKFLKKGHMIRFGSIVVLIAILILIYQQNLVTFTFSYSLILMTGIIVNVNMMAYRQEIIPSDLFGRVMTSSRVLVNFFSPIAMILAGWIATKFNVKLVFEVAAIIITINVFYAWFSKLRYIR